VSVTATISVLRLRKAPVFWRNDRLIEDASVSCYRAGGTRSCARVCAFLSGLRVAVGRLLFRPRHLSLKTSDEEREKRVWKCAHARTHTHAHAHAHTHTTHTHTHTPHPHTPGGGEGACVHCHRGLMSHSAHSALTRGRIDKHLRAKGRGRERQREGARAIGGRRGE